MSAFPPPPSTAWAPRGDPSPKSTRRFGGWRLAVLAIGVSVIAAGIGISAVAWAGKDVIATLDPIPPSIQVSPAVGVPEGWVTMTASDGSFVVTGPGPGTMSSAGSGVYRIDEYDWDGGSSCVLYLQWIGPQPHPADYMKSRLLDWVGSMRDPHGPTTPVELGAAIGWRTQLGYEDGQYPVGAFQDLYARGWEYSMGCSLPITSSKKENVLVRRYLDSFEAPASLVTTQP